MNHSFYIIVSSRTPQNQVGECNRISAMSEGTLQLPEYQWWLDVLTTDNVDLIKQSLLDNGVNLENTGHNDEHKAKRFLNGNIKFSNTKYIHNHCSGEYKVSKPFFLAAMFGTKETLDLFMELDVDIYQQDKHGNSVIQNCIYMQSRTRGTHKIYIII